MSTGEQTEDAEEDPDRSRNSEPQSWLREGKGTDVVIDAAQAEELTANAAMIATLEAAAATLKECGAMKAATNVLHQIRKARRRSRKVAAEDSGVLVALARQREAEEARERERRRLVDEANARTMTVASLRREAAVEAETLRKRKQAIRDAEGLLETKHAMKSFSLGDLG